MAQAKLILVSSLILYHDALSVIVKNNHNTISSKIASFNSTLPKNLTTNHLFTDKSRESEKLINDSNYGKKVVPPIPKNEDSHTDESSVHETPYSNHEFLKEVSTKPNYTASNRLKHPVNKDEILDFVPTKLYSQVRGKKIVRRVPQKYAVTEAESDEDVENAKRLREVVRDKKINTVYTEEGYEDSAYDHAGHVRNADFEETSNKELQGSKIDPKSTVNEGLHQLEKDLSAETRKIEEQADKDHDELSQIKEEKEENEEKESNEEGYKVKEEDENEREGENTDIVNQRTDSNHSHGNDEEVSCEVCEPKKDDVTYGSRTVPLINDNFDQPYLSEKSIDTESGNIPDIYTSWSSGVNKLEPESRNDVDVLWESFKNSAKVQNTDDLLHESDDDKSLRPKIAPRNRSQLRNILNSRRLAPAPVSEPSNFEENKIDLPVPNFDLSKNNQILFQPFSNPLILDETHSLTSPLTLPEAPMNIIKPPNFTNSHVDVSLFSPFAQQFDSKLNRYTFIVEDHDDFSFDSSIDDDDSEEYKKKIQQQQNQAKTNFEDEEKPKQPEKVKKIVEKVQKLYMNEHEKTGDEYAIMKPPTANQFINTKHPEPYPDSQHYTRNLHQLPRKTFKNKILKPKAKIIRPHQFRPRYMKITKQFHPLKNKVAPGNNFFVNNRRNYIFNQQLLHPNNIFQDFTSNAPYRKLLHVRRKRSPKNPSNFSIFPVKKRKKRSTTEMRYLDLSPVITDEIVTRELNARFPETNQVEESDGYQVTEDYKDRENSGEVADPDISDYSDSLENSLSTETNITSHEEHIDSNKYPYYNVNFEERDPQLRYIINPNFVPKKTFGGMEFYDSRTLPCSPVEPDLDSVGPEEEPTYEHSPRLNGLGTKLDCFKAKYFDSNPLDNPLFQEKIVESPRLPKELRAEALVRSIPKMKVDPEDNVFLHSSRKPENFEKNLRRKKKYRPNQGVDAVGKTQDQKRKRKNPRPKKNSASLATFDYYSPPITAYGKQVYDDVMYNIQNADVKHSNHRPDYQVPGLKRYKKFLINANQTRLKDSEDTTYVPYFRREEKTGFPLVYITTSLPILENASESKKRLKENRNRIAGTSPNLDFMKYRNLLNWMNMKPSSNSQKSNRYKVSNAKLVDKPKSHKKNQHGHRINKRNVNIDRLNYQKVESNRNASIGTNATRHVRFRNRHFKNGIPSAMILGHGKFSTLPTLNLTNNLRRNEPRYNQYEKNPHVGILGRRTHLYNVSERALENDVKNQSEKSLKTENLDVVEQKPLKQKMYYNIERGDQESIISLNEEDSYPKTLSKRYEVHEGSHDQEKSREIRSSDESRSAQSGGESRDLAAKVTEDSAEDARQETTSDEDNPENSSAEVYSQEEEKRNSSSEHESPERIEEGKAKSPEKSTFYRFTSRPSSSSDSFENSKYFNLRPRLTRPKFYQPSFPTLNYKLNRLKKRVEDNSESVERSDSKASDESKRSFFPWESDEDMKESKHYVHSITKYEYPWEKRARLARERKAKNREGKDVESLERKDESSSDYSGAHYHWYLQPRPSKMHYPQHPYTGTKVNVTKNTDDVEGAGSRFKPVIHSVPKFHPIGKKNVTKTTTEAPIETSTSPQNLTSKIVQKPGRSRNMFSTSSPVSRTTTMIAPIITNATRVAYVPAVARNRQGSSSVEILKTNPKRPRLRSQTTTIYPPVHKPSTSSPADREIRMKLKLVREGVTSSSSRPTIDSLQTPVNVSTPLRSRQKSLRVRKPLASREEGT